MLLRLPPVATGHSCSCTADPAACSPACSGRAPQRCWCSLTRRLPTQRSAYNKPSMLAGSQRAMHLRLLQPAGASKSLSPHHTRGRWILSVQQGRCNRLRPAPAAAQGCVRHPFGLHQLWSPHHCFLHTSPNTCCLGPQAAAHAPASCSQPAAAASSAVMPSGSSGTAAQAELAPCQPAHACSTPSATGLLWQLPNGVPPEQAAFVWVGAPDAPALRQRQLEHSRATWSVLDPSLIPIRQQTAGPDAVASADAASGSAVTPGAAAVHGEAVGTDAQPAALQPDHAAAPAGGPVSDANSGAWQQGVDTRLRRTLQRRYYLVEKVQSDGVARHWLPPLTWLLLSNI